MPKVEFGIIDNLDYKYDYNEYEPKKYNCISINDDYINDWWDSISFMKSYLHSLDRKSFGLDRHGTNLIPPESIPILRDAVLSYKYFNSDNQLADLVYILEKARVEGKYIIHFGV